MFSSIKQFLITLKLISSYTGLFYLFLNCKRICEHGCFYFFKITFKWLWCIWYFFGQLWVNICKKSIKLVCYFLFSRYLMSIDQSFSWQMRLWFQVFTYQSFHSIQSKQPMTNIINLLLLWMTKFVFLYNFAMIYCWR